ncbi:MAG: hypothetical protein NT099_10070 [Candidatus Saganbacteria bacterium]|nr:hypothetical protein [Candidatus Saganbacteria bacterium]
MKKIISILLVSFLGVSLLGTFAFADLAIGYETYTVFPHAFVLSYNDPGSGWGLKASSDFGTSMVSMMGSIISIAATVGFINPKFSFTTLALTKDIGKGENTRDYLKLGVFNLSATSDNGFKSNGSMMLAGVGREWENFLMNKLSGNVEIGYPELLLLGLRYHF